VDIESRIRASVAKKIAGKSRGTPQQYYQEFQAVYESRKKSHRERVALENAAEVADLGPAAYALGVHFALMGKTAEAQQWLRIAADRDIGDASFRLAKLHEGEAVKGFNRQLLDEGFDGSVDAEFSEAHYWYHRAALSGYAVEDYVSANKLETPLLSLDCCPKVRSAASDEVARRTISEARVEAYEIRHEARADVNLIIEEARSEVSSLAAQRRALTDDILEFRHVLSTLSSIVELGRPSLRLLLPLLMKSRFSRRSRMSLEQVCGVYSLTVDFNRIRYARRLESSGLNGRQRFMVAMRRWLGLKSPADVSGAAVLHAELLPGEPNRLPDSVNQDESLVTS
jgi:hypothetical protein